MPCNSDYMEANGYEKSISRVACLLDELDGKPIKKDHWRGYHPSVYCRSSKELGDQLTAELCQRLTSVDVSKHSLEMQLWWRDHQHADKVRKREEAAELKVKQLRDEALAKLTPAERKALDLD